MGNCINVKRRQTFISLELEDGENSLSKAYLPQITFQRNDHLPFSTLFHKGGYNSID